MLKWYYFTSTWPTYVIKSVWGNVLGFAPYGRVPIAITVLWTRRIVFIEHTRNKKKTDVIFQQNTLNEEILDIWEWQQSEKFD